MASRRSGFNGGTPQHDIYNIEGDLDDIRAGGGPGLAGQIGRGLNSIGNAFTASGSTTASSGSDNNGGGGIDELPAGDGKSKGFSET